MRYMTGSDWMSCGEMYHKDGWMSCGDVCYIVFCLLHLEQVDMQQSAEVAFCIDLCYNDPGSKVEQLVCNCADYCNEPRADCSTQFQSVSACMGLHLHYNEPSADL